MPAAVNLLSSLRRSHLITVPVSQLWRAFQSDEGGAAAPCSSEPGADENGGIESADEVRRRAGAALAEIAAAHAGQRVVVVSHGGRISHEVGCDELAQFDPEQAALRSR